MAISKEKIALITTVKNPDLYQQVIKTFPSDIQLFMVDGTKGLYGIKSLTFFLKKLRKYEFEWLIMADEDVVFLNPENIFDLVNYLAENDYTVCGMRDGGELKWRNKNPHSINTFFAILNLKEILSIYNEKEMLSNQYIVQNEFEINVDNISFNNYDSTSLFESYYCFFFWLKRRGKKFKFLQAANPFEKDPESTLLYDHNGQEILCHTWYSRFYNKNKKQTARINNIIKKGAISNSCPEPIFLRNNILHVRVFFYKYYRRLVRAINFIL